MGFTNTQYFYFQRVIDAYDGFGTAAFEGIEDGRPVVTWMSGFDDGHLERERLQSFALRAHERNYQLEGREPLVFTLGYLNIETGTHPDGLYEAFKLGLDSFMTSKGNAGPLTIKMLYVTSSDNVWIERRDHRARFSIGRFNLGWCQADHRRLFPTRSFLSDVGRKAAKGAKITLRRRSLVDRVLRREG